MSINFDALLKKGKESVSLSKTDRDKWDELIATLMHTVHTLNGMYSKNTKHNMKLEHVNCTDCQEAMFVLAIRTLDSDKPRRTMRYHKAKWKYISSNKYFCEKCKKD